MLRTLTPTLCQRERGRLYEVREAPARPDSRRARNFASHPGHLMRGGGVPGKCREIVGNTGKWWETFAGNAPEQDDLKTDEFSLRRRSQGTNPGLDHEP